MTQPNASQTAKKKSRKPLIAIVAAVLVLAAAGGALAWRRAHAAPSAPTTPHTSQEEQGLLTLEPFVVNLADQGGSRFLRVSMRLVVGSRARAERVQKDEVSLTRIRSSILDLLTEQTADRLVTAEGKTALRHAIATRVEPLLEDEKVTDVLFSDFVVQF